MSRNPRGFRVSPPEPPPVDTEINIPKSLRKPVAPKSAGSILQEPRAKKYPAGLCKAPPSMLSAPRQSVGRSWITDLVGRNYAEATLAITKNRYAYKLVKIDAISLVKVDDIRVPNCLLISVSTPENFTSSNNAASDISVVSSWFSNNTNSCIICHVELAA
jgi:hypothetical protein